MSPLEVAGKIRLREIVNILRYERACCGEFGLWEMGLMGGRQCA
jgi:hypothetical protein